MINIRFRHILSGILLFFLPVLISPSCATQNQAKIDTQKKGLMLQDKSEYSRNKRHFHGNAAYKKQMRRQKRYKKNRMRR